MISNIGPCCYKQCFGPNKNFYIEVKNSTPFYIYNFLKYSINGKTISKPNPLFGPGKTQRVTFPYDALNLNLSVYNCYYNPPLLACSIFISDHSSSCFNVTGTTQGTLQCIPVKC